MNHTANLELKLAALVLALEQMRDVAKLCPYSHCTVGKLVDAALDKAQS